MISTPGPGFEPAKPDLEDVYFSAVAGRIGRRREAARDEQTRMHPLIYTAPVSEIADATPVPEWALFLGKFLGLSLVLVVWMALVATAGVLGQMRMGYFAGRCRPSRTLFPPESCVMSSIYVESRWQKHCQPSSRRGAGC